jgi:site-specific recombinase XerD
MKMERTVERGIFTKRGKYGIRYTDSQGVYRRENCGTLSQARNILKLRQGEAIQGKKLPASLRRAPVVFADLAGATREYITKKYAKPKHDLGCLETLISIFGDRRAESLTPPVIEAILEDAGRDWHGSSFNHFHTLMGVTFRLAIREGKLETNPMRYVKRRRENNDRVRYLTTEEEAKLRQVIHSNPSWAPHEPELTLAMHTGLRRSSMYGLEWEQVDLIRRMIDLPTSKNGKPLHIPLNRSALAAMKVFLARNGGRAEGAVIRNESREALVYPTHWFVPAIRQAGIKSFRWHDLRHTFASRLVQQGTSLATIADLLGHKSLLMTRRYAHLAPENLHTAVAALDKISATVAPAEIEHVAFVQ